MELALYMSKASSEVSLAGLDMVPVEGGGLSGQQKGSRSCCSMSVIQYSPGGCVFRAPMCGVMVMGLAIPVCSAASVMVVWSASTRWGTEVGPLGSGKSWDSKWITSAYASWQVGSQWKE